MTDAARETPPARRALADDNELLDVAGRGLSIDHFADVGKMVAPQRARIAALRGEKPPRITVPAPREKREDNAITKKNIEQALRLKKALERAHAKIVFQHTHL